MANILFFFCHFFFFLICSSYLDLDSWILILGSWILDLGSLKKKPLPGMREVHYEQS